MAGRKKLPIDQEIKLLREQVRYLTKQIPKKLPHRPYLFTEKDFEQIEALCSLPCIKETEVADIMGVSVDTLCKGIKRKFGMTYAEFRHKKEAAFKFQLGHMQRSVALKGNVTMLIFLGKNYLGQSDKQETTIGVQEGSKLVIEMGESNG